MTIRRTVVGCGATRMSQPPIAGDGFLPLTLHTECTVSADRDEGQLSNHKMLAVLVKTW
jgi:hypothetical protein